MSNRQQGVRGAAGHAAPLLVLRLAALLAVLMWVLPVCTHAGGPTLPNAAASTPGSVVSTGTTVQMGAAHACPDARHGPGDAHCRPATGAAASPASPVPGPPAQTADVTTASSTPGTPPARGASADLPHSPGIHQLQVQRI
ncbi:hypothetical protein IQ62_26005 [Streptomyces scabiei]|uniref:hypothetical protein n=1 Tax=Streptomyces scabiei TaxID=1930 RepID=UPI0004E6F609|nr:hypothetical protein [Streptomyces scabiei]KFF98215.1 hypothetical protein IQ62_26005 [Streptomyces scabiei]